jgi:hypothetical protein
VTSINQVSPSECQSGYTTSKSTKKDKFSREKSPLPSVPQLEIPLGNPFTNISSSKNIPSIPQKGTLGIAEAHPPNFVGLDSQPTNLVGLPKIPMEHVSTPMRTVHPSMRTVPTGSQVHILQDQSHLRNTVPILHGWTLVSHRDKKVSSL